MDTSVSTATKLQFIADKNGVTPQKVQDIILNNNVLIPEATYRAIIGSLTNAGEGTYDCVVFRSDKAQRTPARLVNDYISDLIKGMNEAITKSSYRISYH